MIQKRRPDALFRRNVFTRKYLFLARLINDVVKELYIKSQKSLSGTSAKQPLQRFQRRDL